MTLHQTSIKIHIMVGREIFLITIDILKVTVLQYDRFSVKNEIHSVLFKNHHQRKSRN